MMKALVGMQTNGLNIPFLGTDFGKKNSDE